MSWIHISIKEREKVTIVLGPVPDGAEVFSTIGNRISFLNLRSGEAWRQSYLSRQFKLFLR